MSSDAKIQLNFKTRGGSLLNLYAQSAEEAGEQLDALSDLAGRIGEVEALLGAVSTVATTPPSGGQSTPQAAAPSSDGVPVCSHGTYEYRSGTNKTTGKPWSGYFCPSKDRNDQHDPKWNR